MKLDGRQIARDLIAHRNLWEVVLPEKDDGGKQNVIKLRDLYSLSSSIIYIGIKKNRKDDFERLAERWNPSVIQYLPVQNQPDDEMVVELCF